MGDNANIQNSQGAQYGQGGPGAQAKMGAQYGQGNQANMGAQYNPGNQGIQYGQGNQSDQYNSGAQGSQYGQSNPVNPNNQGGQYSPNPQPQYPPNSQAGSQPSQSLFMDWDDEIEEDGQEFLILEEGDYRFEVTAMERGRSKGSGKIPACNMATITLAVDAGNGKTATCRTNILLYRTLEWKISQFFRSIGQKLDGQRVKMDWNKVIGSVGRAHFKPRSYTAQNGEERQTNEVSYFIDYDGRPASQPDLMAGFSDVKDDAQDSLPFD